MIGKTWDDLLWLYLAGQLSDEDRALFERLLAENPERRAELAEWETLSHVVQEEAGSRVTDDALPMLTPQFFARLDAEIAKPSMNGSHKHRTIESEKQLMIETIRPVRFNRIRQEEADARLRFRPSWTLAAAMIAVVLLAGLLYAASQMNDPDGPTAPGFGAPPDEEALEQRASHTPVPTSTPTREYIIVTATPIGFAAPFGVIMSDGEVSLLDAPSDRAVISAVIEPQTRVHVLGQSLDGEWYMIQLENGHTGWVSRLRVALESSFSLPPMSITPIPSVVFSPSLVPSPLPPEMQLVTATPIPALTLPPTAVIPSPFPNLPPNMNASATPIQPDVQLATIAPTVPAPQQGGVRNPAASITPSQLQPIVSAPARVVSSGYVSQGGAATSIDWSGDMLAVSTFDSVLLMQPEQLNSGSNVVQLSSDYGFVSVAFSPDGSLLAALDWNSTLTLWHIIDRATHERVVEIEDAPLWGDLIFSADGTRLISDLGEGHISIEYADDGSIETLDMNPPGYEQIDPYVSPDFTRVVDGFQQELTVIDAETREEIMRLPMSLSQVDHAVFSYDNAFLAVVSSQTVGVIEIETGELVGGTAPRIDGRVFDLAFSPDGRFLAYITNTGALNSVWVRDLAADAPYAAALLDRLWNDLDFSPDSTLLAVASSEGLLLTLEIAP